MWPAISSSTVPVYRRTFTDTDTRQRMLPDDNLVNPE